MIIFIILNFMGGRFLEYDRDRVMRLMGEVKNVFFNIYEFVEFDEEEFLRNKYYIFSVKYNFLVVIEVCIDIVYYLILKNKLRLLKDYLDVFEVF